MTRNAQRVGCAAVNARPQTTSRHNPDWTSKAAPQAPSASKTAPYRAKAPTVAMGVSCDLGQPHQIRVDSGQPFQRRMPQPPGELAVLDIDNNARPHPVDVGARRVHCRSSER